MSTTKSITDPFCVECYDHAKKVATGATAEPLDPKCMKECPSPPEEVAKIISLAGYGHHDDDHHSR